MYWGGKPSARSGQFGAVNCPRVADSSRWRAVRESRTVTGDEQFAIPGLSRATTLCDCRAVWGDDPPRFADSSTGKPSPARGQYRSSSPPQVQDCSDAKPFASRGHCRGRAVPQSRKVWWVSPPWATGSCDQRCALLSGWFGAANLSYDADILGRATLRESRTVEDGEPSWNRGQS